MEPSNLGWPKCNEYRDAPIPGSMRPQCELKRGHPGLHNDYRNNDWGTVEQFREQLSLERLANQEAVSRLADWVATMEVNYVGQEGRGAASVTRDRVLAFIKDIWGVSRMADIIKQ